MKRSVLTALIALLAGPACGGTWTAPLSFEVVADPGGSYLRAGFDLGVELREIESASVTLTLPDGFRGVAVSSGYSSLSTLLTIALAGPSDSRTPAALLDQGPWLLDQETPLTRSLFNLPAGEPVTVDVPLRLIIGPIELPSPDPIPLPPPASSGTLTPVEWPEELFAGLGQIAIGEVAFQTSIQPGIGGSSPTTVSLGLPNSAIVDASVTVTGVAVPEPGALVLVAIACAAFLRRARESRE